MIWPPDKPRELIDTKIDQGYTIRTYQPGDEGPFLSLMSDGDFDPWNDEKLQYNIAKIIPEGWFFAVEIASKKIVGTAMCLHNYSEQTPFTGDVGWLACHPDHRGLGLGYSLTAYVTNRFLSAGYTQIQLHTEHYRLPAVKTYLKLGYLPLLSSPAAYLLWQEIGEQIGWAFTPERWPCVP